MKATGKRATESFVVNLAGQTTMPTSGTLSDSSTGNINLNNGQLGIVSMGNFGSVAMNSFVDATPTLAEANAIAIFQGTSASSNVAGSSATYPLWVRPYRKTQTIDGATSVFVTKQAFRGAKHSAWVVGNISSATSGGINILDETEYRMTIAFKARFLDEMMAASRQVSSMTVSRVTPDFTTLSATYTAPVDWIVSYMVYDINRNSQLWLLNNRYQGSDPVVAFGAGIALSGPSGAAAGTAISSLTVGSTFNVFTYGGVNKAITITQELLDTLTEASTDSGFTHLFTIDLANAGTATGGTATGIIVVGLDRVPAYVDYIPQLKTSVRVGLKAGFDYTTVRSNEYVSADEGQGYGRVLDLLFKATQGQNEYAQRHTEDPVINFASPIDTTQQYVVYNINHGRSQQIDTSNMVYSPYREIICLPRYSSGTTTNALIATFDSTLNNWLSSTGNSAILTLG